MNVCTDEQVVVARTSPRMDGSGWFPEAYVKALEEGPMNPMTPMTSMTPMTPMTPLKPMNPVNELPSSLLSRRCGEEAVGCLLPQVPQPLAGQGIGQACPNPLPSLPPVSGLRSYPLRGSHSLDDLLDRPGNSTAPSEYWDGQSRSRTPSRVPSRAPSPAPPPLPSSRRSSIGSTGVATDVKVSPRPPSPGASSG
ncbi:hypothetical protein P7K49_002971 [Saguinus oedipus]|uniref:Uncharacterized protein n=1 Tax=Saguinus oedipus TaxID=9490 RepID=A0ABQ9WJC7_SAGOE|nr:hypothetical protein P7K49_002971 [Saguinus oedipus]